MLIDRVLPHFHSVERHEITAVATPDELWSALETADLGRAWPIRVLTGLRAIPAFLAGKKLRPQVSDDAPRRVTLRDLGKRGFHPMAEEPGREIVFGIEGRFWVPVPDYCPGDLQRFAAPLPPGVARAAWNFLVEPVDERRSRLVTITRIECADRSTLMKFRAYWLFVRPFSGLIRIMMLRAVRDELRARRTTPGDAQHDQR
jgi:hypothetical protein